MLEDAVEQRTLLSILALHCHFENSVLLCSGMSPATVVLKPKHSNASVSLLYGRISDSAVCGCTHSGTLISFTIGSISNAMSHFSEPNDLHLYFAHSFTCFNFSFCSKNSVVTSVSLSQPHKLPHQTGPYSAGREHGN